MEPNYLTVSALTKYISLKFTNDPYLQEIFVVGEVSNFRRRVGHQYFSIKDENSKINVTMFEHNFKNINFNLEEGMKILVNGYVGVYAPHGSYQIIAQMIQPYGIGNLYKAYEQLKDKLANLGLFSHTKRAVVKYPRKIAIITSQSGAVIRDIMTTVARRYPFVQLILFPAAVQGVNAADEIVSRIKQVNLRNDIDTLILGRGGGSIEDLWPFNEEKVAYAIFESKVPVISSVGHETDTTISDLVADIRAATPTAAAELATPNIIEIYETIKNNQMSLIRVLNNKLSLEKQKLFNLTQTPIFRQPTRLYDSYIQKLDFLKSKLHQIGITKFERYKNQLLHMKQRFQNIPLHNKVMILIDDNKNLKILLKHNLENYIIDKKHQLKKNIYGLDVLSPLKIMERGYSYVLKDKEYINTIEKLSLNEEVDLHLKDGVVRVKILKIRRN